MQAARIQCEGVGYGIQGQSAAVGVRDDTTNRVGDVAGRKVQGSSAASLGHVSFACIEGATDKELGGCVAERGTWERGARRRRDALEHYAAEAWYVASENI